MCSHFFDSSVLLFSVRPFDGRVKKKIAQRLLSTQIRYNGFKFKHYGCVAWLVGSIGRLARQRGRLLKVTM
jgi:hypothetical protein